MQQSENTVQSPNAVPMTSQRRSLWVNIETALVECHLFAQSIYTKDLVIDWCWASVLHDLPALNPQCAAMLAQHWTEIWWLDLHPLYEVQHRQVLNERWSAPAMVMEEKHVEDIFLYLSPWFFPNYILDISYYILNIS